MTILLTLLLQLQVHVELTLPTIRFSAAPIMVEAEPGILVVHDHHEEVVFVDGWYWLRWGDGRWYRARNHRGGWVHAEPRVIPVVLMRAPPGHYRRYRAQDPKWRMVGRDGRVVEAKGKRSGRPGAGKHHPGKHSHAGKFKPGKGKRGKRK